MKKQIGQTTVNSTPRPSAVDRLKYTLRSLSKEDKDNIWEYLDGNPEAIHELIACVVIPEKDQKRIAKARRDL